MRTPLFAAILQAGIPGLQIISVIAVVIFAGTGAYIYRHRRQLFDRDPDIAADEDGPAVRHIRLELVLLIWGALMVVLLATLYQIWLT